MGPHGRMVPLSEAGGAPDWVREMTELVAAHPGLRWVKPEPDIKPHVAVWTDADGEHRELRDELRDLVLYLRERLGDAP